MDIHKIGILTLQWGNNYGGLLQCFALSHYLQDSGFQTEVINYWPDYALKKRALILGTEEVYRQFEKKVSVSQKAKWKNRIWGGKKRVQKLHNIDTFRNTYIPLSKAITDINQLKEHCQAMDAVFVGSDQVWNPNITGNDFDDAYFLNFDLPTTIRATYAASTGIDFGVLQQRRFLGLADGFDCLSARERTLSELLEKELKHPVSSVLDPVFLPKADVWKNIMSADYPREKYILVYTLEANDGLVEIANDLAQSMNLPIYVIGQRNQYHNVKKYVPDLSVPEFLSYINNAEYVVTNSFHGTAFSVLFHKNFYTIPHKTKPARMVDLLSELGISDRLCNNVSEYRQAKEISYEAVDEKLETLKSRSEQYIQRALSIDIRNRARRAVQPGVCIGCEVCKDNCPTKAISMSIDLQGFYKASVDAEKCVGCGRCREICPVNNPKTDEMALPIRIYAAKNQSDTVRAASSSGGIFSALAKTCIDRGGVVYGAAFVGKEIRHIRAESMIDVEKCRGSKYVQSYLDNCFENIRKDLQCGREVLFTGTSCQVAGLKQYIKLNHQNLEKLFTADIICHGTPSQRVFYDFCRFIEGIYRKPIESFAFRDKTQGWRGSGYKIKFCDETEKVNDYYTRAYSKLFTSSMNETCFHCPYARNERVSDITMADFWGIENTSFSDFEDRLGVSLMLINSEHGMEMLQRIQGELVTIPAEIGDCIKNKPLFRPTPMPPRYYRFWDMYLSKGSTAAFEKYCKLKGSVGVFERVKWFVMYRLGLKNIMLHFFGKR